MISDLVGNSNTEKLSSLTNGLIVTFASMTICYIIGVSKIIKVERKRIGTFRTIFFASNSHD
mgnify:CR=1 FL=1